MDSLTTLTAEQTEQVAGGIIIIIIDPQPPHGCPTCTSGKPVEFQNEVARLAK
jgi:hypothetical protein